MLLNKQFKALQVKYLKFLQQKFPDIKSSKKLNEWHLFTERDLLVELEKQKIKILMKEHYEFFDFFVEEKTRVTSVLEKIQLLENEINTMIYALYDLNADEIKMVEQ